MGLRLRWKMQKRRKMHRMRKNWRCTGCRKDRRYTGYRVDKGGDSDAEAGNNGSSTVREIPIDLNALAHGNHGGGSTASMGNQISQPITMYRS